MDTIFAPATAAGRAGVAVVRLSGPASAAALTAIAGRLPTPRRATLARFRDPASGEILDQGLALWFPGPQSFTGEDMAELHGHGSHAAVAGILAALSALPGLRLAEAGEFTRRAFDNGKLDLTEVEGLADLIVAETGAQRRQAMAQAGGALSRSVEGWRTRLVRILAHHEAAIDFAEDELPGDLVDDAATATRGLLAEMRGQLAGGRRAERLRRGVQVAILGAPNVGKSSLLNALAQRDVAIVSDRAGTTRDVVEVHLDLGGVPVTLADTAGLHASDDPIEQEGMRRARAAANAADIRVLVLDDGVPPVLQDVAGDALPVWSKADLRAGPPPGPGWSVSARTGDGLDAFVSALAARAAALAAEGGDAVLTRERHRAAVADCVAHLERSLAAALPELAAEDLRLAARALGRITGRVDIEDLLDVIFREFCIGK